MTATVDFKALLLDAVTTGQMERRDSMANFSPSLMPNLIDSLREKDLMHFLQVLYASAKRAGSAYNQRFFVDCDRLSKEQITYVVDSLNAIGHTVQRFEKTSVLRNEEGKGFGKPTISTTLLIKAFPDHLHEHVRATVWASLHAEKKKVSDAQSVEFNGSVAVESGGAVESGSSVAVELHNASENSVNDTDDFDDCVSENK